MVDAGAAQDDPLAVEGEALLRRAADGAEAEAIHPLVLRVAHAAGVEDGRFGRPGLRVLHGQAEGMLAVAVRAPLRERLSFLFDTDGNCARARRLHLDLDDGGIERQGADAHAVHQDVLLVRDEQVDGAVDARARVPAAVGLLGVFRHDAHLVLRAVTQKFVQRDVEVGVAVGAVARLFAVDVHLRVAVHTFKFEGDLLVLPCGGGGEGLDVLVVVPLVPPAVGAACVFVAARLADHRVVREGDLLPRALAEAAPLPAFVPYDFLHLSLPPGFCPQIFYRRPPRRKCSTGAAALFCPLLYTIMPAITRKYFAGCRHFFTFYKNFFFCRACGGGGRARALPRARGEQSAPRQRKIFCKK